MKIAAHPDNIEALVKAIERGEFSVQRQSLFGFELIRNPLLPRDRPNGKYQLPDGIICEKCDVCVTSRFVTYGPEDVEWLVYAGIITECREMYYYVMPEFDFITPMRLDPWFVEPRYIIKNFA